MSPLELAAILLFTVVVMFVTQAITLFIYHYYFLVPLFKLMSYQSGANIPTAFEAALTSPFEKRQPPKEPRSKLEGQTLRDIMDKLTNAI
jgi:hypothetical protein